MNLCTFNLNTLKILENNRFYSLIKPHITKGENNIIVCSKLCNWICTSDINAKSGQTTYTMCIPLGLRLLTHFIQQYSQLLKHCFTGYKIFL